MVNFFPQKYVLLSENFMWPWANCLPFPTVTWILGLRIQVPLILVHEDLIFLKRLTFCLPQERRGFNFHNLFAWSERRQRLSYCKEDERLRHRKINLIIFIYMKDLLWSRYFRWTCRLIWENTDNGALSMSSLPHGDGKMKQRNIGYKRAS